jgi:hypothetical protein
MLVVVVFRACEPLFPHVWLALELANAGMLFHCLECLPAFAALSSWFALAALVSRVFALRC